MEEANPRVFSKKLNHPLILRYFRTFRRLGEVSVGKMSGYRLNCGVAVEFNHESSIFLMTFEVCESLV